jgi:RNA polymerase sigma factor (TIGR02999 family)
MPNTGRITELLHALRVGDQTAQDDLFEIVYQELRRLARRQMAGERSGHTLQPTALVNEAYLRLLGAEPPVFQDRAHFFAMAAQVMRRVLVDHARARRASKRGGTDRHCLELTPELAISEDRLDQVLQVDEALTRLATIDARQARIVELRYFSGLSEEEIADVLEISARTVKRDWKFARAWLRAELRNAESAG